MKLVDNGEISENKAPVAKKQIDSNKKSDSSTKIKTNRKPKRKKNLLDELTRPQKKSLMSYLLTPLDPIAETNETQSEVPEPNIRENKLQVSEMSEMSLKKTTVSEDVAINPSVESKENVHLETVFVKSLSLESNIVSERLLQDLPTATIVDEPCKTPTPAGQETKITKKSDAQTYDKKSEFPTLGCKVENQNYNEDNHIQSGNIKIDAAECIDTNKREIKEKNMKVIESSARKEECDSNTDLFEFSNKNEDLEWNRENMMKIFGINVADEDICSSEIVDKLLEENYDKKKAVLNVADNSGSSPACHAFSLYKSHSSKEYLFYLHELAIAKKAAQIKDKSSDENESSQSKEEKKQTCENKQYNTVENPMTNIESCHPNEGRCENELKRNDSEYAGDLAVLQCPLNLQTQRSPSTGFQNDPPKLKKYIQQTTQINNLTGLGSDSKPVSYESTQLTVSKFESYTKSKSTRQPKRKKTLLDELTRPQKKSLMSYLITPLDPIAEINETQNEIQESNLEVCEINKISQKKEVEDIQINPSVDVKDNVTLEATLVNSLCPKTDIISEKQDKLPQDMKITTSVDESSITSTLVSQETIQMNLEKADAQIYDKKGDFPTPDDKIEVQNHDETIEIQTEDDINVETVDNKEIEERNMELDDQSIEKEELVHDSNTEYISCPNKNLELGWNRENAGMKMFGIVRDEGSYSSEVTVKLEKESYTKMRPILPPPSVPGYSDSIPAGHAFSLYKSRASKEYLSYLHGLAVAKNYCSDKKSISW
ncbi:hypothetical protein L9F63_005757 [Diploptera punctata]|uniref:Uncharacterized protein n=1 Tax=Diploptera punctata TaxID=6984 RepID=A0AAD8E5V1_DIPPU|nr:hypothetical protein L9F63_005757 [Diploptera punctata]